MTQEERYYLMYDKIFDLKKENKELREDMDIINAANTELEGALKRAEEELKAAIKDVPNTCKTCYLNGRCNFDTQCFGTNMENWKWRGKGGEK